MTPETRLIRTLSDADLDHLECRDARHLWQIAGKPRITERLSAHEQTVERTFVCDRCLTEKTEKFVLTTPRRGVPRLRAVGSTQYTYPKGYLMPVMRKVDHPREVVRAHLFLQTLR